MEAIREAVVGATRVGVEGAIREGVEADMVGASAQAQVGEVVVEAGGMEGAGEEMPTVEAVVVLLVLEEVATDGLAGKYKSWAANLPLISLNVRCCSMHLILAIPCQLVATSEVWQVQKANPTLNSRLSYNMFAGPPTMTPSKRTRRFSTSHVISCRPS